MALFQALLIVIIQNVELKSNFSELGYIPVPSCPKRSREWNDSSLRLNCTETNKYHCAPYLSKTSQLYEFCYRSLHISKGNCIGIKDDGNINAYTCEKFVSGCPGDDYSSSEIHKYPKCLGVQGECFTEDRYCICLYENTTATSKNDRSGPNVTTTKPNCTFACGQNTFDQHQEVSLIIFLVIFIILFILSLVVNIFLVLRIRTFKDPEMLKCCTKKSRRGLGTDESTEENLLHVLSPIGVETEEHAEENLQPIRLGTDESAEENLLPVLPPIGVETEEPAEENLQPIGLGTDASAEENLQLVPLITDRKSNARESDKHQSSANMATDDIYKLTLVDYTIEDTELFILLKRQCLHQAYFEFIYLVKSRVKDKKEYIFTQSDENGCILLHYAAQGGSIAILNNILENVSKETRTRILQYNCIRGQNALHFAIREEKEEMIKHLIDLYSKSSNSGGQFTNGVFAPVHWVAWQGKSRLLRVYKNAKFDVSIQTRNELNILDVACLSKLSDVSNKFCIHVLENKLRYNIDPMKEDKSGWKIGHYAAMSGRVELLKFMEKNETLRIIITAQTKSLKTCLHIACEFANFDAVEFLVTKFASLLHREDHLNWNALHFAAKGGRLKILEYLLANGLQIGCLTKDQKTILHVACIHKNLDISRYAVEHLSSELLNTLTNTSGLLASHYLAVEKTEGGNEAKILEVLCNSDMDLTATCFDGFTLLDWAIDHLNIDLIRAIVSVNFREKCGVDTKSLKKAITRKQDQTIITILQTALNEMNEKSK